MYYRSVNRGILITVPGRYTIALVLALGLIAIASGYNGVYLSLSLGIAILIISGLLSEKVMKQYEVHGATRVEADADAPFSLELKIANRDASHILYGVENLVYDRMPRFRALGREPEPRARAQVLMLEPLAHAVVSGTCSGLPRGFYSRLFVVQRTLYPFGLLSKFKVSELPTEMAVLPRMNEELRAVLRRELELRVSRAESDREFYTHRQYSDRDASRNIDWKRSAGRATAEWVVKVYESRSQDFGVWIHVPRSVLTSAPDDAAYEERLSALRTAVDVVRGMNRSVLFDIDGEMPRGDAQEALRALAEAPAFRELGSWRPRTERAHVPRGTYLKLVFDGKGHHWEGTGE